MSLEALEESKQLFDVACMVFVFFLAEFYTTSRAFSVVFTIFISLSW